MYDLSYILVVAVIMRYLRGLDIRVPTVRRLQLWKNDKYVSPYDSSCPIYVIVLYNPSSHANNVAVTDLLSAWPNLRIVQVCQEGRLPVVGVADQFIIPKVTWGNMAVFTQHYEQYVIRNRFMKTSKVGFYPVWSAMEEDANIARSVEAAGLRWIGAKPAAMKGLGKIEYKRFCASHGLPTLALPLNIVPVSRYGSLVWPPWTALWLVYMETPWT